MDESTRKDPSEERWFVGSLARGLSVLSAFDAETPLMTTSQVAEKTGMSRAAARRFLMTLEALGFLASDEKQSYVLSANVLELGYTYMLSLGLDQFVMPILGEVTKQTGETTNLAVLKEGKVVYLVRSVAYRPTHVMLHTGDWLPAYATSMGRVMLARLGESELSDYLATTELKPLTQYTRTDPGELRGILEAARGDGYALVEDELAVGIMSIAVPVLDSEGNVLAAINLSSQSGRLTRDDLIGQVGTLQEAARKIELGMATLPLLRMQVRS
ncbi:MAG: IclR family transcriptional regulator C-terminal domain-containing protein [Pseudomonadota bacterium]|nr:IclR family transcriptional regulator C-terminal domain-containing protein [Pseudomonadota bacterium]